MFGQFSQVTCFFNGSFCNFRQPVARDGLDGSSLSTLVQMVGAGIGVTLLPDMAVPVETRAADVAVSRFTAPCPKRVIGMVWRKSSPLAAQLMQMAEAVRETGKALQRAQAA